MLLNKKLFRHLVFPEEFQKTPIPIQSLKPINLDQIPCIFLVPESAMKEMLNFANTFGLSTFAIPNSLIFVLYRSTVDSTKNQISSIRYPIPYSYIKNSYYFNDSHSIKSIVVIADDFIYFDEDSMYREELLDIVRTLGFTKITIVCAQGDSLNLRGNGIPLACNFLNLRSFNLNSFDTLKLTLEENSVVINLSDAVIPWVVDFAKIARIPYFDLSNSSQFSPNDTNSRATQTLLGRLRQIESVFADFKELNLNENDGPILQKSENVWREEIDTLISIIET